MEGGMEVGVITFEGSEAAQHLVKSLAERQAGALIDEVGIIEHHANGGFSVHGYAPGGTRGQHAAVGALVGTMFGLLLGPFGLVAGLFGGAAVGASMTARDPHELEVSDAFIARLRESLPPGTSAVLLIGQAETVGQLMGQIQSAGAVTKDEFREPLTDEQAAAMRQALEGGAG
ncbi:MAG: DUF1269 domain-containing protein [Actinomycetota bacterium]